MDEIDAQKLILFMASFCWNCTTEESFEETVKGNESTILEHFKRGVPGWASAAAVQDEQGRNMPEEHM